MATSDPRPLKMLCPCGYSKKLPAAFNGKKVVCPECRNVLSVTKIKAAQILIQCPYCQKTQIYKGETENCNECNGFFYVHQLEIPFAQADRERIELDDIDDTRVTVQPSDTRSRSSYSRKRGIRSPRLRRYIAVHVIISMIFVSLAWHLFASKFGLPGPVDLLARYSPDESNEPSSRVESISEVNIGNVSNEHADFSKLCSPAVSLVDGSFVVDQVLERNTSLPAGFKTVVSVNILNLSDCEITGINIEIKAFSIEGALTRTWKIERQFAKELAPHGTRKLMIFEEAGNWSKLVLVATSVRAGEQTDNAPSMALTLSNAK